MMKKIRITRYQRYLLYVVGLVVAILFTVTGVKAVRAEDETTVTVMLHKVLLDENDTTTKYDNQGTELAINDSALLNGAGFTVYDVTSLVDAGSTLSDLNKLNDTYGASYFDEKGLKVATEITGTTGTKGLATFQLPKLSNSRDAKYFIIETTHPEIAKLEMSQPIFLAFPLSQDISNPVHLYPKNYQYVRDPYFYKHGKTTQGQDLGPLAGATFRLYKVDANGNKLYLHEEKRDNDNQWVDVTNPKVSLITSDKNGLVTTGNHWLPIGEYFFEEVTAPNGYLITDAALKVKVTVPADSTQPVTITVAGKTTTMPDAVVDNLIGELPQTPGEQSGILPITGEQLVGYTALGSGMILLMILVVCKYKQTTKINPKEIGGDTR